MRHWELTLAVILAFVSLPLLTNGSSDVRYNNPLLGVYQNEEACFPLEEKWYIMYRNYKDDPYFGSAGQCIKIFATGPFVDNSGPFEVDVGDSDKIKVEASLLSSPGYTVKNVIHVDVTEVPGLSLNLTAIYTDCSNCKVIHHDYVNEQACSLWQPQSTLGQDVKCCHFIYDLLCGPKYPVCEDI
ncbi:hypothetical protein MRX96_008658 [Rhipicephalus microplus]|uniref:uncharacterized protein LOC119177897 n=1 Tax=Rhipicephalus microplus TaxID=6941 RepID=UPI003F6CF5D3